MILLQEVVLLTLSMVVMETIVLTVVMVMIILMGAMEAITSMVA